jgi:hypothetical protein
MKKKSIIICIIILIIVILGVVLFLFRGNVGGDNVGNVKIVNQSGVASELKGHKKADTSVADVLSGDMPVIAYTKNSVLEDVEKSLPSGSEDTAVTTLITTSDEIQIRGRRTNDVPVIYTVYDKDGKFISKDTVLNIPAENLRSEDKVADTYIIEINVTWDEENDYVYYFRCNLT